jgi:hypothetical protein
MNTMGTDAAELAVRQSLVVHMVEHYQEWTRRIGGVVVYVTAPLYEGGPTLYQLGV